MNTIYGLKIAAGAALLLACLSLSACPAKKPETAATDTTGNPAGTKPRAEAPGQLPAGSPQAATPETGAGAADVQGAAAAPDAANPKPSGSDWVWAPKLSYRIGESIKIEFASGAGEKAWIGLIPSDITAADAATNDASDVAYAYLPKDTNMLSLDVPDAGSFVLKLISGSEATDKVLFTSPVITAKQWDKGDRASKVAPFITLGEQTKPGKIELPTGAPLPVYWMLPEVYPSTCWVGLIPVKITSLNEGDNDAADIDYQYVKSGTQGTLTFVLNEPGDYVFRLFPSNVAACEAVAESEPFTVFKAPSGQAAAH